VAANCPHATRSHPAASGSSKEKPVKVPTALIGCQVWRTAFDYQVRLTLIARHPDEGYRVDAEPVIDTSFLLCDAAGEWHELEPSTGSQLAFALDLFHEDHHHGRDSQPRRPRSHSRRQLRDLRR
jgi:hypothetical protein